MATITYKREENIKIIMQSVRIIKLCMNINGYVMKGEG
jgi:hypothetical protein